MVIYRCSACGNIVRASSPPTISKCGACGEWLVTITREDAPKPMIVEKVKENEGKQGMTLLDIVKAIAYAWGTSCIPSFPSPLRVSLMIFAVSNQQETFLFSL